MNLQTKADLEKLITDEVEESLHLDYKSSGSLQKSDGKINEISKDVSSFANSDGGTIIYGIKEFDSEAKRHLPEKIDPINRTTISKEWLEQVINSNISPRIENIEIVPINVDSSNSNAVYIVNIPKSTTAHQARDLRYYKRYNFESIPMNDYEIRDVLNRSSFPRIEIELEIFSYKKEPSYPSSNFPSIGSTPTTEIINQINIRARNHGEVYANYVNSFIEVPEGILNPDEYGILDSYVRDGMPYKKIYCDNTIRELYDVNPVLGHKYWPSRYDPILPGLSMKLVTIQLKSNVFHGGIIYWSVNADNAPTIEGEINIDEISRKSR